MSGLARAVNDCFGRRTVTNALACHSCVYVICVTLYPILFIPQFPALRRENIDKIVRREFHRGKEEYVLTTLDLASGVLPPPAPGTIPSIQQMEQKLEGGSSSGPQSQGGRAKLTEMDSRRPLRLNLLTCWGMEVCYSALQHALVRLL